MSGTGDGNLTVGEAGARGGRKTAQLHPSHHRKIGEKGGKKTKSLYGHLYRTWGRQGGRPRKKTLSEVEEEPHEKEVWGQPAPPLLPPL